MQPFTRSLRWAIAMLALLMALPSQSFAQGKIKVAIWEFENHADGYWYSGKLGPAARDQIDTEFSENSALSSKFSVIERDKLALVLKEQGLATSGAVDPSSAAKVGKILGVKYIILGGVDKLAINNTTAERVVSISSDGEIKKGGGFLKGDSLSRDSEWGIASETIQKTAKAI